MLSAPEVLLFIKANIALLTSIIVGESTFSSSPNVFYMRLVVGV